MELSHYHVQQTKQPAKAKANIGDWSGNESTQVGRIDVDIAAIKGKVTIAVAHGAAAAFAVIELDPALGKF